jgi:hypothetical protein
MALISVLTEAVRPERIGGFEEVVRKLAEKAVERREALHWGAHQTAFGDLGTIYFVRRVQDWAELAEGGTGDEMIRRVLGDKEGQRALEQIRECLLSATQTVAVDRLDLSYSPEPAGRPAAYNVVTMVRARPGGQEAFEEFLRKISEAIPKLDDPGRTLVLQNVVGDLREYRVIRPLQDLRELDGQLQPADLLQKAFGAAEGGLLFRTGLEAIEHAERRIVAYRADLSNPA